MKIFKQLIRILLLIFPLQILAAVHWNAVWITHPTADLKAFGVYHFRKAFELEDVPAEFVIHLSADNRYRLFVNGKPVVSGPARGDLNHWRFETIDIATSLRKGKNVLAAQVHNAGESFPMAQVSEKTAFIVQGTPENEALVNTNHTWTVVQNPGYSQITYDELKWWQWAHGWYAVGGTDRVQATRYLWDWEKIDFDDSNWLMPKSLGTPAQNPWHLEPRPIPLLEERQERFQALRRTSGISTGAEFLQGTEPLIIPANKKVTLLLDQGQLTVGYPELWVSGGAGSIMKIIYAESLFDGKNKGNRHEIEGKEIKGYWDLFYPDGGENRLFRPLWLRTYRYVQLEIETHAHALKINDYYTVFTAYSFQEAAEFVSDVDSLQALWKIGWRTARCCAVETYMDCPYYEQLNYAGDSRIQALISLYISGDARLMRDAIQLLSYSMMDIGITQACYPLRRTRTIEIPPYALFLISMIHDFYWHRQEDAFIQRFFPTIRSILNWFDQYVDETGLLANLPLWNFADWNFKDGTPDGARKNESGRSALITLQLVYTLQQAVELFDHFQMNTEANRWAQRAEFIKTAVYQQCFDSQRKIFADTPEKRSYSQHTNIFAILTDAIPEEMQPALLQKILTESDLTRCTTYFKFYLFRALQKTKMGADFLNQLDKWFEMAAKGFTTFGETGELSHDRSDCHAWSAHPMYFYLALIAGIMPAEPGFQKVQVAPQLGPLKQISARMPHPNGTIEVALTREGTHISGQVVLPENISGDFLWQTTTLPLQPGDNVIELGDAGGPKRFNSLPQQFHLGQNYPNPFNPRTFIPYHVFTHGQLSIKILNVLGHEIQTLVNKNHQPGHYIIEWDGNNNRTEPVASGTYFYQMQADAFLRTEKLVLLK